MGVSLTPRGLRDEPWETVTGTAIVLTLGTEFTLLSLAKVGPLQLLGVLTQYLCSLECEAPWHRKSRARGGTTRLGQAPALGTAPSADSEPQLAATPDCVPAGH